VTVDEMELIGRLGEVDPLSDEALAGAEMTLRKAIFASETLETAAGRDMRRPRRPRRYLIGISGVAASAIIVVGALALVAGGGRPAPTHAAFGPRPDVTRPTTGNLRASGTSIRLASYSFNLPSGYKPVRSPCAVAWPSHGPRMSFAGATSFARSTDGGCVAVFLAAGVAAQPPEGAQPVQVGSYKAYLVTGTHSGVVLFVEIPARETDHALVVIANGLTPHQVVAIAESGLPTSIFPTTTCTSDCA
jgi:hypothetical protein